MNPHRLITGDLLAHIETHRLAYPRHDRPSALAVQNMVRYLVGWSRLNTDGRIVDEARSQIAEATAMGPSTISRIFGVLERAGVVETVARGGSRLQWGSRRRLHLDAHVRGATDVITGVITECADSPHEFGANPHQFAENPHEIEPSARVSARVPTNGDDDDWADVTWARPDPCTRPRAREILRANMADHVLARWEQHWNDEG